MSKSKKDKPLKSIRSSFLSRQLSLAKLGLKTGSNLALNRLRTRLGQQATPDEWEQIITAQIDYWAQELGELKGSLMKAGQLLSIYGEHFLPPKAQAILKKLQAESPALAWNAINKILTKELGAENLAKLTVEKQSSGTASIGQVHRARVLATGENLALKIQYPGVRKAIDSDLKTLRYLLNLAKLIPNNDRSDQVFNEVKKMLRQEMDYRRELKFTQEYGDRLQTKPAYLVPKVFPDFSSSKVLATSFIEAEPVDSPKVAALSQDRRNRLATLYLELYFTELFVWQEMQTDPHIGNYKIYIGSNIEEDRLVLLDFGAMRKIEKRFGQNYRQMIKSILYKDIDNFFMYAERIGLLNAETDSEELYATFEEVCQLIIEPFKTKEEAKDLPFFDKAGNYDWQASDLPKRLLSAGQKLLRQFTLRLPPHQIIFLDRKLAGTYTFITVLKAKFYPRSVMEPFLEQ